MTMPLPRGARAVAGLRRGWLPATVALLAAGLAGALAVTLWAVLSMPAPAGAAPEVWPDAGARAALVTARQCGVRVFTLRSATVDRDLDAIAGCATADYARDLARARATLRKAVLDNRSQSSARVVEAALTGPGEAAGGRVTALLAVDVTTRSARQPAPQTQRHRVRAELTRVRGRWLIARLRII